MSWKLIAIAAVGVSLCGTVWAQTDEQKRERTHESVKRGVEKTPSPAQAPKDTGGRDIKSFKGYQGKPRKHNRPYKVPKPKLCHEVEIRCMSGSPHSACVRKVCD
jgi:hypothetical protein